MLLLAHQLGHKVTASAAAATTVMDVSPRFAYTHRRKRPYAKLDYGRFKLLGVSRA